MQQARIVMASQGKPTSVYHVKTYQRDVLGRKKSDTCLLELLPLTSPSTRVWHFAEWSQLPYLVNRNAYQDYCIPWRCNHIRTQIRFYQPKLVIFFGMSYFNYWQTVVGQYVLFGDEGGFKKAVSRHTMFLVAKHPATMGIKNVYFEEIGKFVKNTFS